MSSETPPAWVLRYEAGRFKPWSFTVDVVAIGFDPPTESLHAAVVVRGGEGPYRGYEAWPGGFVSWDHDSDARTALLRELHEETGLDEPAYLEELRTYDAYGRDPRQFAGHADTATGEWVPTGTRIVSKAFLGLLRRPDRRSLQPEFGFDAASSHWASVYGYLPWEDLRDAGAIATLNRIRKELVRWADSAGGTLGTERHRRIERYFTPRTWNEEDARARWDTMVEVGLVEEGWRDRWGRKRPDAPRLLYGEPLAFDHRAMLADALGVLRSRIKREPEIASALIGSEFKLSELQALYEAVGGRRLYRSNFRRTVALSQGSTMVEPLGRKEAPSGPGKPADLFRFSPEALHTRHSPGLNLPWLPIEP